MKREIPMVVVVLTTLLRLLEFLRHLIFHVALWGYLRLSSMLWRREGTPGMCHPLYMAGQ